VVFQRHKAKAKVLVTAFSEVMDTLHNVSDINRLEREYWWLSRW